MSIEIKTATYEQKRQTFDHIARRLGSDRTATRYEEATMDLQWEKIFHYAPLWAPDQDLFDKSITKITMDDWYALRDPRQFYYASYNIARSRQVEASEHNFEMVEKNGMLKSIPSDWIEKIVSYLIPLRHYEWGANMNNSNISSTCWGAALSNAAAFHMADRLGNAQLIGRIALAINDNGEQALNAAKDSWMNDPKWTELRHLVEDTLVLTDPIEQYIAQNFAMDGIVHPLMFNTFKEAGNQNGASAISFLTSTVNDWMEESNRWIDFIVKTMASENTGNKSVLKEWSTKWNVRTIAAITPLAFYVLGDAAGKTAITEIKQAFDARCVKLGLA